MVRKTVRITLGCILISVCMSLATFASTSTYTGLPFSQKTTLALPSVALLFAVLYGARGRGTRTATLLPTLLVGTSATAPAASSTGMSGRPATPSGSGPNALPPSVVTGRLNSNVLIS